MTVVTKEQYNTLYSKIEQEIKDTTNNILDEKQYTEFVLCTIGVYKDNYSTKYIFDGYFDSEEKIDWEAWQKNVLESWEDICKYSITDEQTSLAVIESIWFAMQDIPDIIKNVLQIE